MSKSLSWNEPLIIQYAGFEVEIIVEGDDLDVAVYRDGVLVKSKWVPADKKMSTWDSKSRYDSYTGYTPLEKAKIPPTAASDMAAALRDIDEEEEAK